MSPEDKALLTLHGFRPTNFASFIWVKGDLAIYRMSHADVWEWRRKGTNRFHVTDTLQEAVNQCRKAGESYEQPE